LTEKNLTQSPRISAVKTAGAHPGVTRRTALKAFGTSAVVLLPSLSNEGLLAFSRIQAGKVPPSPKALSTSQFATLEQFVEAIIPADDRSPGAMEARVADYIDLLLSESDDDLTLQWIGGLAALDAERRSPASAPHKSTSCSPTSARKSSRLRRRSSASS